MNVYTLEEEYMEFRSDGDRLIDKFVLGVYKHDDLAVIKLEDRLKELQDINHERGEPKITRWNEHDVTITFDDDTAYELSIIERVVH